jgi:uncharacterized protein involved in high-affinity Fe2+ transport
MKKLINLLMALFVVFAIASCGAGAEKEAPVTEEPTEEPTEVADTTAAPAKDEAPAEEGEEAEGEEAEAPAEEEEH